MADSKGHDWEESKERFREVVGRAFSDDGFDIEYFDFYCCSQMDGYHEAAIKRRGKKVGLISDSGGFHDYVCLKEVYVNMFEDAKKELDGDSK